MLATQAGVISNMSEGFPKTARRRRMEKLLLDTGRNDDIDRLSNGVQENTKQGSILIESMGVVSAVRGTGSCRTFPQN